LFEGLFSGITTNNYNYYPVVRLFLCLGLG
jgi:hypothetical protein